MRILLFLCALALPFKGQSSAGDTSMFPRWYVKGFLAPEYGYVTSIAKTDGLSKFDVERVGETVKFFRERSAPKFGYIISGLAGINFTKNIFVESGLQFSDRGYRYPKRAVCTDCGTFVWVGRVRNPTASRVDFHYRYLSVPLYAGYRIPINRKYEMSLAVGGSYDRLMDGYQWVREWNASGHRMLSFDDLDNGMTLSKNLYNVLGRIGVSFPVREKWALESSAMFRYSSEYRKPGTTPIKFHWYGSSIGIGLIYKL